MNDFKLYNGVEIPAIGYGTWQTPDSTARSRVAYALQQGYKHIDTAACYANERGVGRGIAESGLDRDKIFVTSKVWNSERGYKKTLASFEKTLNDLALDYLDLYLIHWPASPHRFDDWEDINTGTWQAMVELYMAGKVRAIGVSNFLPHHLERLMSAPVKPMVNQIEFHPGFMQKEVVDYCAANGILVEAWSPLGTGKMLNNGTLKVIAAKYGVSVAQLCIRWCLEHGVLPLPKSVTPERIVQNLSVNFNISAQDMEAIDALPYIGGSGLHPDKVDF